MELEKTITTLKPSEILKGALKAIGERGWYQGGLADYSSGVEDSLYNPSTKCAVCLVGALNVGHHGTPNFVAETPPELKRAQRIMADVVGSPAVASWNDTNGRTVNQVTHALQLAIAAAKEKGE